MTSHHQPHLIIDNTHRPLDYDRSPEPDTPIVFTGAEVWFAFFLGGVFVVVVEVVASFAWSFA